VGPEFALLAFAREAGYVSGEIEEGRRSLDRQVGHPLSVSSLTEYQQ